MSCHPSDKAGDCASRGRLGYAVLVAILVAAACGGGSTSPSATSTSAAPSANPAVASIPIPPTSVVIGVSNAGFAGWPVKVAEAKGYFKEQNLDVTYQVLTTSPQMEAALAAGQVHFTIQGISASFYNATARGIESLAIAGQQTIRDYEPLMVSKAAFSKGTITKVSDLKGKKVAVNATGSSVEYFLNEALKTGGLRVSDVTLVVLTFADMITALSTGAIDGAQIVEPSAGNAERLGIGHRLVDNYLPNAVSTFVFTDAKWASAHKDAVVRFLKAWRKGVVAVENGEWQRPDVMPTLVKWSNQSEADLVALGNSFKPIYSANGAINPDDIAAMQQYFLSRGALTYTTPVSVSKFADTSYLTEARR